LRGDSSVCAATRVIRYDHCGVPIRGGCAGVFQRVEAIVVVQMVVVLVVVVNQSVVVVAGGLVPPGPRRCPRP
jgi:hypothetical protein